MGVCNTCKTSVCGCELVNGECANCRGVNASKASSVELELAGNCQHSLSSQAVWLNILSRVVTRNSFGIMGTSKEDLMTQIAKLRMNLNSSDPCLNDVTSVRQYAMTALAKGL